MKKLILVVLLSLGCMHLYAQSTIYLHDFGTVTISGHPYTVSPNTLAANLSNLAWSNSTNTFTSFAGVSGQALSLANSGGTPTITLTIVINAGFTLDVTAFNFWRQRSASGAQNWEMQINGMTVGSGTVPTSGAFIGESNVATAITGLTDTVSINFHLSGATGTGTFRLDNFELIGQLTSLSNPSITLSSPSQISASNVNQGASNHIFSAFQAAVTADSATLNSLSFISSGTYTTPGDLSNYRLWYHTSAHFGAATNLGTLASGVASGQIVTFNSLNQTIAENSTGYFWITADVAPGAIANNTIHFTSHDLTFISGNQSGTIADGGAQTIQSVTPLISLSSPNPAVAASNIYQNSINNILYRFDLETTVANTSLTAFNITTNGTYAANGVSNLKAWYSADVTFDAVSDVLLSTITNPTVAGVQSFSGMNQLLISGTIAYIFVTVDISCEAAANATIGIDAIATADITTTATKSGTANAGGTQSIQEAIPLNATALVASVANVSSNISWTNPTGCFDEVIVVVKAGSSISGTPSGDGSAYAADLDFAGAGTTFDGGKVVYKGTTSGQSVTGLSNGTQYFVKIYSRNGESWSTGVEADVTPTNIVTLNFDDAGKWTQGSAAFTSYSNHSYTDGQVNFQGTQVIRNTTAAQDGFIGGIGTYSFRLQDAGSSKLTATITSGGVNTFSVDIRRWDGSPDPDYTLRYSVDGGDNYTNVTTINNASLDGSSDWKTFNGTINSPFSNILIEIIRNNGERIMVDNFVYSPRDFGTTTWNGSAWSSGTPDATKNVVISGNLNNSSAFSVNNLTIESGINLSFAADEALTVNGDLVNNGTLDIATNSLTLAGTYSGSGSIRSNGGEIVLNGTGDAGSLRFDQSSDGTTNSVANFTLNRTNTGEVSIANKLNITNLLTLTNGVLNASGFVHLKSTSSTATVNVVGGTNASVVGNVTVERYLPWLSADNDGFRFVGHSLRSNPILNTISNLPVGNNTVIRYDEAANSGAGAYVGVNDRTTTWSQAEALGIWTNNVTTLSYTGELQLSDVGPINLSNSGSGWLYVANPFPSVVDYHEVTRNNVNNAKYRWVKDNSGQGNGNWGSYVGGVGSNGGSRKIAPGQGFMVKTTGNGAASISFPANSRTSSDTVTFVRAANMGDIFRATIKKNNNNGMETVIRFHASATNAFDEAWDAYFLSDYTNNTPDLYTVDAQGNKYSINSLPELTSQPCMVPLYFEAFETGNYQWSFDDSEMLSASLVQLEDTKTGQVQTVGAGQLYSFTLAANDAVNRFRLHFNGMSTSVVANQLDLVQIYTNEGVLYVRGIDQAQELRILDVTGRMVYSTMQLQLDGQGIRPELSKGTYLVQIVTNKGVKTSKVIF